ncbi:MAG: hypothetical protein AMXMBFR84_07700 [Candidatus Hydrogenedentota bacterium]
MTRLALCVLLAMPWIAQAPDDSTGFEETDPPAVEYPETTGEPAPTEPETPPAEDASPTPADEADSAEFLSNVGKAMGDAGEESTAEAPTQAGPLSDTMRQLLRSVMALAVVLALMLLLFAFWKRFGKQTPLFQAVSDPDFVKRLGRVALDPKTALHFLRVKDTILVVAVGPNGVYRVAELDDAIQAPVAVSPFLEQLKAQEKALDVSLPGGSPEVDEISSLRKDIERLQDYLRETAREVE